MLKKEIFLFIFLILFSLSISASCSESQINVNSASISELDKIYGIGPAKAQAIIDARPYETLDDLVNAYGIGEATLEKIKQEGLACVDGDKEEEVEENEESEETEKENDEEEINKENEEENIQEEENTEEKIEEKKEEKIAEKEKTPTVTAGVIKLDSKDIKTKNNKEELDKNKFAKIGLGFIAILLLVLLILKNKKGKIKKNEFR
jgi:competence ComEA-like helix-hairpin-helix protein